MSAIPPIGCCLCLNLTGHKQPASVVINGYSACDEHAEHLTGEFSDFHQLVNRIRHTEPEEPF